MKNRIKKSLLTSLAGIWLLFICRCDTSEAWLTKGDRLPAAEFGSGKTTGADSAKYSLKAKQESLTLNFSVSNGNNNLKHVRIRRISGDSADPDKELFDGIISRGRVKFTIKKTGVSVFDFTAADVLGGSTTSRYTLTVFENLPPTAKLAAIPSQDNKYLYTLDASGSKDGDQKFGGNIQIYRYTIDGGYTFDTASPSIPRTFFAAGRHVIKLVTVDNEGMVGEALTLDVNIPQ